MTHRIAQEKISKNSKTWLKQSYKGQQISFSLFVFNGISTIIGYLIPKPSLKKNSSGTI